MIKYFLIFIALFLLNLMLPSTSLAGCAGGAYVVVGRQACGYTPIGTAYVSGTADSEWQSCRVVAGYGCVRASDSYGTFCATTGPYTCSCTTTNSANTYYWTTSGCYDPDAGGGGGYPAPPYDTPYDTPYGAPYTYPYPAPADFTPTNFYLKDAGGNKSYNFAEDENIFWYAQIKNIGELSPDTAYGVNVYANLYEDQAGSFNVADDTRTPTYIKHANGDFTAGDTLTFDSRTTGTNTGDFLGSNDFSLGAGDGKPITARVFVDPLNQYPDEATNFSNNQATFRYTVGDPADLVIESFYLKDNSGTTSTAFDKSENIFPHVKIRNQGGSTAMSKDVADKHNYTWLYADEPAAIPQNTVGDTNVEIQNGEMSKGSSYTYYCRPSPGANCDDSLIQQAWDTNTKGVYTARVFTNFDRNVIEGTYTNNQGTIQYSVGYTIQGRIYADMNKSGGYSTGIDFPLDNITVTFTGPDDSGIAVTGADGKYTSPALEPGTYSITTNVSSDYSPTSTSTYPRISDFTSRDDLTGQDIRYFPKYTITGNVFVDTDDSQSKDGAEVNHAANPGIVIGSIPNNAPTPPAVTNNADGTYTVTGLISGTYTIEYPNLPNGSVMTHPVNTTPPSFSTRVGSSCVRATPLPGGSCSTGNLIDVNFGIKAGQPWFQALGLDVRIGSGFNDPLPPSPAAACGDYAMLPASSTTPGIIFTGAIPAYTWRGGTSSTNWVVGGSSYPETPPNGNSTKTSYGYLLTVAQTSGITITELSTKCTLTNCTLPSSLATGAIYKATGNVTLNSFTVPASKNFVILVNGDLTIRGAIRVPTTSTILFSVSGNITIDPAVGSTATCPPPLPSLGDLEGFYSADKNFTVQTSANCAATVPVPDKQLNIQGAVIVNAGQGGGSFSNTRDLCTGNTDYPSLTLRERPDFILNAPDFLRVPSYIWQEVAP